MAGTVFLIDFWWSIVETRLSGYSVQDQNQDKGLATDLLSYHHGHRPQLADLKLICNTVCAFT